MSTYEWLQTFLDIAALPLGVLVMASLVVWAAYWVLLRRHPELGSGARIPRQLVLTVLTAAGLLAVLLTLPLDDADRSQLTALLGLGFTGVIALSSTTFVANAMAGLMARVSHTYRPGDFVRVGSHFGRVTEQGLFHTEIQTEDRDLTTLPNLFLVSNPVTVVRASGTIVSASLSLGYNLDHSRVERVLGQGIEAAGLKDGFVQVLDLGDYSVTYRAAGFLAEVKHVLSARSNLRKQLLDALHSEGIEIVSPTFMNQRVLNPAEKIVAVPDLSSAVATGDAQKSPEAIVFDKAEAAARLEKLRADREELLVAIKELQDELSKVEPRQREPVEHRLRRQQRRLLALERLLTSLTEENGRKGSD